MKLTDIAINHTINTARIPSFSSFEERIHPYINSCFKAIPEARREDVTGNNLIYRIPARADSTTIALTAHLDKINHYGKSFPEELPANKSNDYLEGAMDNCAGLGILLAIATASDNYDFPELLFFFSEMEESKGLKEHPELLKNNGNGYEHGMGARRIATSCISQGLIPDEVITIDTTPLFKGDPGVALYSKHWDYNGLDPSPELKERTQEVVGKIQTIDPSVRLSNNTNDYLHYGKKFNETGEHTVVSIALEPAIFPYHQKGERVYTSDIERVLNIMIRYLKNAG